MTASSLFSIGRSIGVAVVVSLLSGCPEAPPTPVDGGSTQDAGRPDAGGNPEDAGQPDAGDAGPNAADAGIDAGVDAGIDAGIDSGIPDAGCSSGTQCNTGLCVGGNCVACQDDAECGAAAICNGGVCGPGCTSSATCDAGQDCCTGRCFELQQAPGHCGSCGQACTTDEFCSEATCHPADFSQLCQLTRTAVVLDRIGDDDDAGLAMGSAISTRCTLSTPLRSVGQLDSGVLASNGMPIALGELLVMAGGSFAQRGVKWMEDNGVAQVSDTSTSVDAIYSLRDGGVVSTVPLSTLGPTLDRVVVQLVRTPAGALVLNAAGYHGPGTLAAARYFVDAVLPAASTLTTRWYVVEWEDLDGTPGPSAGDRYTVIASGS